MAQTDIAIAVSLSRIEHEEHKKQHEKHLTRLQNVVHSNGLKIVPVPANGDCFFHATLMQIKEIYTVQQLRSLCSNYFLEHIEEIIEFYPSHDVESFIKDAKTIANPGIWSNNLCDLLPLCVANILERPSTIYTSSEENPIVDVVSGSNKDPQGAPLLYAYNTHHGYEHYEYCIPVNNHNPNDSSGDCEIDVIKISSYHKVGVTNISQRPSTICTTSEENPMPDLVSASNQESQAPRQYANNTHDGYEHSEYYITINNDNPEDAHLDLPTDSSSDCEMNVPLANLARITNAPNKIIPNNITCETGSDSDSDDIPLARLRTYTSVSRNNTIHNEEDNAGASRKAKSAAMSKLHDLDDGIEFDDSDADDNYNPHPSSIPDFLKERVTQKNKDIDKWLSPLKTPQLDDSCNVDSETDTDSNEESTATVEQTLETSRSRKRKRDPVGWSRSMRKQRRNRGEEYESSKGHRVPRKSPKKSNCKCYFGCSENFSEQERELICSTYWALGDYDRQRDFIRNNTIVTEKARKTTHNESARKHTYTYFLKKNNNNTRVCREFFIKTLDIGARVIQWTLTRQLTNSRKLTDERGKHIPPNKTDECDINYVKEHIKSFPALPSHYCRSSSNRTYLQAGLSIQSMYTMYLQTCREKDKTSVSYYVYRTNFAFDFNIGFHTPKKDQCAFCSRFQNLNITERIALKDAHDQHLERKVLARKLKDEAKNLSDKTNGIKTLNFDLQKVLVTPKSQESPFYYSRKLATYNLSVYDFSEHTAVCHMWDETVGGRGSCDIASAIYNYFTNLGEVEEIHMFSDSCTGQQRNLPFATMCMYAVQNLPIKCIYHSYFERGHSQMEGDSVHARIESSTKHCSIYTPEEWFTAVRLAKKTSPFYKVVEMDLDNMYDFKELARCTVSSKLIGNDGESMKWLKVRSFQFLKSEADKFFVKYSYGEPFQAILISRIRRSSSALQSISGFKLTKMRQTKRPISKAKYNDLNNLCKQELIPRRCHDFYRALPYADTTIDRLPEPDEEESSDVE